MSKAKGPRVSSAPSHAAPESPSSSIQILKKLNADREEKEAAIEAMRVRCKTCFKEVAPKRLCGGHGGGAGGGGSSSSSDEKEIAAGASVSLSKLNQTTRPEVFDSIEEGMNVGERPYNPDIIEALIKSGLLVVTADSKALTLSIFLTCEPKALSHVQRNELNKYIAAIVSEWGVFKTKNHLSNDALKIAYDAEGNVRSLQLSLPTQALYTQFIQHLAAHLLPTPKKAELQADVDNKSIPAGLPQLFSTQPTLSSGAKEIKKEEQPAKEIEDEKEQALFNPSPFTIKMTPGETGF